MDRSAATDTDAQPLYPLGIYWTADPFNRYFRLQLWPTAGEFYCVGLRSFTADPNTYHLHSLEVAGEECLRGGTVDAAAYSLGMHPLPSDVRPDRCFWPIGPVPISKETPLTLRGFLCLNFAAPPTLNLALYGHLPEGAEGPLDVDARSAEHGSKIEPCAGCGKAPPYEPASYEMAAPRCVSCG